MKYPITREAWLLAAVQAVRPLFQAKKYEIPEELLVSCGFPSTGTRSHAIGQCWSRKSCDSSINQIFISPVLADPVEVLDTLVHELIHAVDDCQHKHGKEFKKIALSLGLKGPMRSAGAGPELLEKLKAIAQTLGPYPHAQLKVSHQRRAQAPRPRAQCPTCGFQVPMFKRFLEYGPPICPKDKIDMEPLGDWETF